MYVSPNKIFYLIFSLIFLKISGWDKPLLFVTEACEDLDRSTRRGNPSKAVKKTAPMDPANPIHVVAVNLPHKRRRQCTHRQPISRGQLRGRYHGWSLRNPKSMNQKVLKTLGGVCKPVITWMRKRSYTCISEECVWVQCNWSLYDVNISGEVLQPCFPRIAQKAIFCLHLFHVYFMKNLKTVTRNSCCVLWTWWNV